jgi:hypothetical protein
MIVLPDYGFPYILDNVSGPVVPKYSWFYDVSQNDFVLRPIRLLEETIGATVTVKINDFTFDVPASWNLLVVDEETKIVDTVPITQCSSNNFLAFMMHPDAHDYYLSPVVLIDLKMKGSCVHTMIPRMTMMLHPVGPVQITSSTRTPKQDLSYCCLLSPQDLGKHMDNVTAMEIVL